MDFRSFPAPMKCAVFGANGGIGRAFVDCLSSSEQVEIVHAVARTSAMDDAPNVRQHLYDPNSDDAIAEAVAELGELDMVLVATGILRGAANLPEKSIGQFNTEAFIETMRINSAIPALIAKALMPQIKKSRKRIVFGALSARVGSISDNRLGGWHSYRASKAALNQIVKNLSLEASHRNPEAVMVTLHPGTVDTALSEPFQKNVPDGNLFTPAYSAHQLLSVLDGLGPAESGKCFDYAGTEIAP